VSAERSWVAVQHVPFEGPGSIAAAAARRGMQLRVCRPDLGEALPAVSELRGLVVMGGPMGVCDTVEHPYLAGERELLAAAVAAGRAVLGVCLGAQLLAAALGARVYRGARPEIGPGTVTLTRAGRADPVLGAAAAGGATAVGATAGGAVESHTPAGGTGAAGAWELPVVHWHQDTFELPRSAVRLAGSGLYPNQAFRAGACAYGLQFHVELDGTLAEGWREHLPEGVRIDERARAEVERAGRALLAAFFDRAG
jgi:GMP synthase-like glutamine amidotransferase